MIQERYRMNCNAISSEEMQVLKRAKVCVVGCGGLGGHVIELLARLGMGHLVAVDGDAFARSNLNRQLLCLESSLGGNKAEEAVIRVNQVNSEVKIDAHCLYMDEGNAARLLSGCDLAVDALDNVESRLVLEDACAQKGIPLIHGAIGGWCGQVPWSCRAAVYCEKFTAGARPREKSQPWATLPLFRLTSLPSRWRSALKHFWEKNLFFPAGSCKRTCLQVTLILSIFNEGGG